MSDLKLDEFQKFLEQQDRSDLTVKGYTADIRIMAKWYCDETRGQMNLTDLTAELIRQFKKHMLQDKCKPNTINRRLASIAKFADWAMLKGYLPSGRNPAQSIRPVKETEFPRRWLNQDEQKALLQAIENDVEKAIIRFPRLKYKRIRDSTIIRLMLHTGLKVSEVVGLRLGDIELSLLSSSLVVRQGRGLKRREIPLNEDERNLLKNYLALRPQTGSDFLFVSSFGDHIQTKMIRRATSYFAHLANLSGVSPQTLRRTYAMNLVNEGKTLEEVATLLGHRNIISTRIYNVPSRLDLEKAVETLEESEE